MGSLHLGKSFVWGVCAHEKLPNFEKLWDDFIQEETKTRRLFQPEWRRSEPSPHQEDEERRQERRTQRG
jgi:hypothetical protein